MCLVHLRVVYGAVAFVALESKRARRACRIVGCHRYFHVLAATKHCPAHPSTAIKFLPQ